MAHHDKIGNVSVTGTATLIAKANGYREILSLYNNGSATIYIYGGTAVTTSNGYPVDGSSQHHWLGPEACYGITAGGTVDVRYHDVI